MTLDRRRLLQSAPPFLFASLLPFAVSPAVGAKTEFPAALLVPKTGPHAALGRSMERAAMLAQAPDAENSVIVFDTGGSAEGAARAAIAARKANAGVILGPVLASEVPSVVAAVEGRIPVIAFSNDADLRESGAFMMGITARQAVANIMAFAASRGIRRVAIGGPADNWGRQMRVAAEAEGSANGIAIAQLAADNLLAVPQGSANSADGLPDAVLWSDANGLARILPSLRAQGIQPLAALPELDKSPDELKQLAGTWLAAPDPEDFTQFSRAFEQRMGTRPGLITALAYDAAIIANRMRLAGGTDRSAVLSAAGFEGVCGNVRFREDGSASRSLTILNVTESGVRKVNTAVAS